MAQTRPAPAAGPVADPGGPSWPLNGSRGTAAPNYGGATSPAVASQPISRTGTSLPVNTPRTQPAGNLTGSIGSWSAAGPVADPGGSRLPIGSGSVIGYGGDPSTPAGGDPSAMGSSYSSGDSDAPTWWQGNPGANPNPGALSGGFTQISALYPGETPASQTSLTANPNPGAL